MTPRDCFNHVLARPDTLRLTFHRKEDAMTFKRAVIRVKRLEQKALGDTLNLGILQFADWKLEAGGHMLEVRLVDSKCAVVATSVEVIASSYN